jgi:transcriptional regulator NrdR family protein
MAREIKHIVKRKGKQEKYDSRKIYGSVYSAALNCEYGERKSERIAEKVTGKLNAWVRGRRVISSEKIREMVIDILGKIDKDVALMYKHHLDLS